MPIPLPPNYGQSIADFDDCGTHLSVSDGDVFKLKERDTDKKNGTLIEVKGAFTSDVTAADGRIPTTGSPLTGIIAVPRLDRAGTERRAQRREVAGAAGVESCAI